MRFYALIILIICFSCEFFRPKEKHSVPPVAQISDKFLYPSDLEGLIPSNSTSEDSTKLTEKYVNDWIRKQLMISESVKQINVNQAEIERKVLDYRYALIVHSFVKKYINENLDETVSDSEIEKYFKEKPDNFLLKQDILKCMFVQIPKNSSKLAQFKKDFRAFPEKKTDEVKNYISQFATKSFLDDSVWVIFDELCLGTPWESIKDKGHFLKNNKFSETSDDDYIYLLKIVDYKTREEVSPLEFIREDIKNIIINKRKITLKKELEDKIYDDAEQQGLFEVFHD